MSPDNCDFNVPLTDFGSGMTKPNPSRCTLSLPVIKFLPEAACGIPYLSGST